MSGFQPFQPKRLSPGYRFGAYIVKGRSPLVQYGNREGVDAIERYDECAELRLDVCGIEPSLIKRIEAIGRASR